MKKLAILILVLGIVPFAFGDQFTLQSYTVTATSSDPGLVLQTAKVAPTPTTFWLNGGDSVTFNLFQIWTSESTVNYTDTVARTISLDSPSILRIRAALSTVRPMGFRRFLVWCSTEPAPRGSPA